MTAVLCLVASVLAPCGSPASPVPAVIPPPREVVVTAPAWHGSQGSGQSPAAIDGLVSVVEAPVPPVASPAPEPPPPPVLSLRERTLNKLAELGAPPWVVTAFDCVGRWESEWRPVDSPPNYDGSIDRGPLQFNSRWHDASLAALGLDPYNPEDAATYGWRLFKASGFSLWAQRTRRLCGL